MDRNFQHHLLYYREERKHKLRQQQYGVGIPVALRPGFHQIVT